MQSTREQAARPGLRSGVYRLVTMLVVSHLVVVSAVSASALSVLPEAAMYGPFGLRIFLEADGCSTTDTTIVANRLVDSDQWFESCARISAENVTVASAGSAVFRAGVSVELGEGFVVEAGGELAVEIEEGLFGDAFLDRTLDEQESHIAVRFYMDLDAAVIEEDKEFDIFEGVSRRGRAVFRLTLRHNEALDENRLFVQALNDDGSVASTVGSEVLLGPGRHYVDAVWAAADPVGAANGSLRLWLDGVEQIGLAGLENAGKAVKYLRLGVVGLGAESSGHIDLDAFTARRAGPIGAMATSSVLFADDFDDNSIDPALWEYGGNVVTEVLSEFHIDRTVTDAGGWARTLPMTVDPAKPITLSRRAKVYAANNYFDGTLSFDFTDHPAYRFGVSYANYYYTGNGACVTVGFALFRNNANSHNCADQQVDTTDLLTPIWGQWFDERLVYDPVTGGLDYYIDDTLMTSLDVGPLPAGAQELVLNFGTWGWNTGHYQYMDDISLSQ